MSETAARPWWADVEHLRPTEEEKPLAVASTSRPRTGRFARETVEAASTGTGAVATLERPDASHFPAPPAPLAPSGDEAATTPARRRRAAAAIADEARSRRAAEEPAPRRRADHAAHAADEPRPRRAAAAVADEARARARRERAEEDLRPRGAAFAEYRDGRRTVAIKGQVDRATAPVPSSYTPREPGQRRPRKSAVERLGSSPDRIAMWAVMLGLLLILVAALSTPGAGA